MLYIKKKIEGVQKALNVFQEQRLIKSFDMVLRLDMCIDIHIEVENELKGTDYYFQNIDALKGLEKSVFIEEKVSNDYDVMIDSPFLRSKLGLESQPITEQDYIGEKKNDKSEYRIRRRFNLLLQENNEELLKEWINPNEWKDWQSPCPIVTFYSYKGGVGRSTTLAAYATYLATKEKKKIIILDCDFEAPGFTNYFDLDIENNQKEGVVEYILDKMANHYDANYYDNIKSKYSYEIDKANFGEIYVIPAGNLSDREDYLEALARIDLSSVENIVNQFKGLFDDLQKAFSLDENSVILIDSRTGFNDTFGILSLLSDFIVGFFGTNIQNQYGLQYFVERFVSNGEKGKNPIIVQSYNTPEKGKLAEQLNAFDFLQTYEMPFEPILTQLGERVDTLGKPNPLTEDFKAKEITQKYIKFINAIGLGVPTENYEKIDKFFEQVSQRIETVITEKKKPEKNLEETSIEILTNSVEIPQVIETLNVKKKNIISVNSNNAEEMDLDVLLENWENENPTHQDFVRLKNQIINTLHYNFPEWYTENTRPDFILHVTKDAIYHRPKIKTFFNDRYLVILGSKGTGKTFLYESFKNSNIKETFCKFAGKKPDNYIFVNVVGLHTEDNFIRTETFKDNARLTKPDQYQRFWNVFICNQLLQNHEIKELQINLNGFEPFEVKNHETSAQEDFLPYIQDTERYLSVERILMAIDKALIAKSKTTYILFDQLEHVVSITEWKEGVTPLFTAWISSPYQRIIPKFFMRADLYDKYVSGFANKKSLNIINLEWQKDEIFAYFFTLLLRKQKKDFFQYLYLIQKRQGKDTWDIKEYIKQLDSDLTDESQAKQLPTKEKVLKPLVELFFGKYANYFDSNDSKFGILSYDWFEKNLKDANEQVSLRPFWGLIQLGIGLNLNKTVKINTNEFKISDKVQITDNSLRIKVKNSIFPILSATFYTHREVRKEAVKIYYEDLQTDKGNDTLKDFHKFMTDNRDLPVSGKYQYRLSEFEALINAFQQAYPNTEAFKNSPDKPFFDVITDFLSHNGIVERLNYQDGKYTNYRFPYLYRGYFQLKGE